jgi:hypothetical protein
MAHRVGAGNVRAPATPGVTAATAGRQKKEKIRKLWMIVIIWTNWKLIKESLGTSWLKEGSDVVVGE